MNRLNGYCLTGAVLAMGFASLPAAAQNQPSSQAATSQDRLMAMRLNINSDQTLPVSGSEGKLMLLQSMADHNFTRADLLSALPLIRDLRDAESMYVFGMADAATNWTIMPDQTKINGMDVARDAANHFRDRRNAIWNALDAAIGADKASAIRPLVEPVRVDVSNMGYTSAHIQRIDQLLSDWDRIAAARVAAAGGTANNANTVSVETTSTTTTTAAPFPAIDFYTFPVLSTQDVVDVMQLRLAALESNGDTTAVLALRGNDLTSPNLRFLRQRNLKYWY